MSHHSDDNMLIATSDSFWEPGNYKRTTKRIEDGHKLCDSLVALVQERAEIEKSYAKALKAWSKNWNDKIEKGPEYGTTEAAWKGVLGEADSLCELHLRIKENLCNDVVQQIKTWQKDTYHKSMMTLKERKEMEDAFKKAQKPWSKILQKVEKAKSDYHNSCKTERSAANQERNASADSSLSPDQTARGSDKALTVKKMQDRVQKTKEEVQKAKEKYESALQEINQYNPKYMEDMTQVFEKCQEMEAQRLQFFKDVLFGIHKCLNISQDTSLPQIYDEFFHTVNNADHEKDLKWWSNNHGVSMAMAWPQFEDYPPVNHKAKAKPASRVISTDANNSDSKNDTNSSSKPPAEKNNHDSNSVNRNSISNGSNKAKDETNPFEEEEWDEDAAEPLVDNGEPGVPVRALYDYEGAEADELSFKQGDIFEKLEDEDEQGWCKGRKDGRVGLYPANYVDLVSP
ncbi:protein kinase C and casein kinase substrate in neurons protein 2 isoform X5 [Trichogramma pretiosum]|uniref:protein kinase C and casein kinase substrate in neurons protein 2 isoform X5 n=1 Tax=Trichogramma pretiosum TaxID=7493 RepID=UPI0006C96C01|nr:protein kinase C and casein kinase substrate in neurons protein 2 isoform X5 [Trichogramma pretiosum]